MTIHSTTTADTVTPREKTYFISLLLATTYRPAYTSQFDMMRWGKCCLTQLSTEHKYVHPSNEVWNSNNVEAWWDTVVKTTQPVKHNKPDLVVWKKDQKTYFIIDICVPLDQHIQKNE